MKFLKLSAYRHMSVRQIIKRDMLIQVMTTGGCHVDNDGGGGIGMMALLADDGWVMCLMMACACT